MRKTLALLLGAAIVAAMPVAASAAKRARYYQKPAAPVTDNAGPRFVAAALHQLVVPLEVTFAPPAPPPQKRYYRRYR